MDIIPPIITRLKEVDADVSDIVITRTKGQRAFRLRCVSTGESAPLTAVECDDLTRNAENFEALALQAGACAWVPSEVNSNLKHVQDTLIHQIPEGNNVFIDTTTIANAINCLSGEPHIGVTSLFDLSTIAFGAVFYDNIITQPHKNLRPGELPSYVRILDYQMGDDRPESVVTAIDSLLSTILRSNMGRYKKTDWSKIWARHLKMSDEDDWPTINLRQHDTYTNSEHLSGLLYDGYVTEEFGDGMADASSRDRFLSAQTERAIFNEYLASWLGLPYIASAIRFPVHAELLRRKMVLRQVADDLLGLVQPKYEEMDDGGAFATPVSLPFFLGIALKRMSNLRQFWHVLKEIRDEYGPLRARIGALRSGGESRASLVRAYKEVVRRELAGRTEGGVGSVVSSLVSGIGTATGDPHLGLLDGLLRIVQVAPLKAEVRKAMLEKFEPTTYVLISLIDQARRLDEVSDELKRLWGGAVGEGWRQRLVRLGATAPYNFQKLLIVP